MGLVRWFKWRFKSSHILMMMSKVEHVICAYLMSVCPLWASVCPFPILVRLATVLTVEFWETSIYFQNKYFAFGDIFSYSVNGFFTVFVCLFLWYWGLNSGSSLWATPEAQFFVMGILEIGSHELFAQAGLKPWSSWSLPPEKWGLHAWATSGAWLIVLMMSFLKQRF
jgi:hypothetical protein